MRSLALGMVSLLIATAAVAKEEAAARRRLCGEWPQERTIRVAGGRIDCISETHAIEIDYTDKWAEALGQALYYASQSELRPGIILLCEKGNDRNCLNHSIRLRAALASQKIVLTLWECDEAAASLDDCLRLELGN